jgi:hypothetical protein
MQGYCTMNKTTLPSIEFLRQALRHDPESGLLYWRPRTADMFDAKQLGNERSALAWNRRHAGKAADQVSSNDYFTVQLKTRKYMAHRVVWAMHNGAWPDGEIDHINHNRQDNRIQNLRVVSRLENCHNLSKRHDNTTGVTGVYWDKNHEKWYAQIRLGSKTKHLGRYHDKSEAIAARRAAELHLGYHKNHCN